MSKHYTLMHDVITKHHPNFTSRSVKRLALDRPEIFNVEHLIEECLAELGGYQLVGGEHQDFCDGSDSKTSSISSTANDGGLTHRGTIKNVRTSGGNLKIGALRVVVYNPIEQNCSFYFLPRGFWTTCVTQGYGGLGIISYSYNRKTQQILRFVPFRCEDFEELAQRSNA